VPAHLYGLFTGVLALVIPNSRKVPHVCIRHFRSHLERPPKVFIVCPEVFIVCPEVFIVCPEVFIVCPEVFIGARFWVGFESGPRRFMELLIRRNGPPGLVRIEQILQPKIILFCR
jgi:hypothetical protein